MMPIGRPRHDVPAWRAIAALLLVGENGGPPDFARIGLMQALFGRRERHEK